MGYKPINAYIVNSLTNYVTRKVSVNGQITVTRYEYLILEYDATAMACYGRAYTPVFTYTVHRHPPENQADSWNVSINNVKSTGTVAVGAKFSKDSNNYAYYSYIARGNSFSGGTFLKSGAGYSMVASGNYVYFKVSSDASLFNGQQVGYPAEDQTYIFSGFDVTFSQTPAYPFAITSNLSGGYKSPSKSFSVSISAVQYSDALTQYKISGGTFYYKKSTDSSYSSRTFTGSTVTIPANVLQSGYTYNVYITARASNGSTANTSTVSISTVDGTAIVSAVSPNNVVLNGSITFKWNYSNTTGELQYAFDLQTSADGSSWTTIINHRVTSSTTATYTQSSVGKTYWRVRGYNQNNVAGSWSSALSYVNNVPPQPPTILEIIPGGRIQVRWSASNQTAYRVQVVNNETGNIIADSGDIYGTNTLYLVNDYLTNGFYQIRVRIQNVYGRASAWATMDYQQTGQLPAFLYYAEQNTGGGMRVEILSGTYTKFYLVRNGILVAKFTDDEYVDLFANGRTHYKLIAVNSEDKFAQVEFTLNIKTETAKLLSKDGSFMSVAERWDGMNVASQTEDTRYSAYEYLGDSVPRHIFSKMRTKRITRAFYDPERISATLLGQTLFYADEYGNADWVVVVSRGRSDEWIGDETTIEMELTAGDEEITYDI